MRGLPVAAPPPLPLCACRPLPCTGRETRTKRVNSRPPREMRRFGKDCGTVGDGAPPGSCDLEHTGQIPPPPLGSSAAPAEHGGTTREETMPGCSRRKRRGHPSAVRGSGLGQAVPAGLCPRSRHATGRPLAVEDRAAPPRRRAAPAGRAALASSRKGRHRGGLGLLAQHVLLAAAAPEPHAGQPAHLKGVRGRQSDPSDAAFLARAGASGMVMASLVPVAASANFVISPTAEPSWCGQWAGKPSGWRRSSRTRG